MFTQKKKVVVSSLMILVLLIALAGNVGLGGATSTSGPAVPSVDTGTAFTYQGHLTDNGSPANGPYDFSFLLYDALVDGTQIGASIVVLDVTVSEGLFTLEIDFGEAFDGQARWLEIAVRPGESTDAYTTLSPRQALTAAPYALGLRPGARIAGDVPAGQGVLNLSTDSVDSYGVLVESSGDSGVRVQSADGSGVYVVSANLIGVYVGSAGEDGVRVLSAGGSGVSVGSAGQDGLRVESAGGTGVRVESSGGSGVRVESAGGSGVTVLSAGGYGLYVISAGYGGVRVESAVEHGVTVGSAGLDGFIICSTGSAICTMTDVGNNNGLDVGQAEDYGARVLDAGRAGFRIDNPGTNGFYAENAGDSGIWVAAATNYAGFFNGDINVTGSCTGCLLATFGVNASSTPLHPGDIVTIVGIEQSLAANTTIALQVHPAGTGQALVGVVGGQAEWHTSGEDGTTVLVPRDGETAEPGDFLTIITYGPVQVQASDSSGVIVPGAKLTLDSNGRVRPLETVEVDGVQLAESSPVIGLALSAPDAAGWVWVLVNPQ